MIQRIMFALTAITLCICAYIYAIKKHEVSFCLSMIAAGAFAIASNTSPED